MYRIVFNPKAQPYTYDMQCRRKTKINFMLNKVSPNQKIAEIYNG